MAGRKLEKRQKIMLALVLILGIVFASEFIDLSPGEFPTRKKLETEAEALRSTQTKLEKLERQIRKADEKVANVEAKATNFWRVPERQPEQAVMQEFGKLVREAQITGHNTHNPRRTKLLNYKYVYQIEFSISMNASMREITRLIAKIEESEKVFRWTQCTIRPDNPRIPKTVRLSGRISALVLAEDVEEIFSARGGKNND